MPDSDRSARDVHVLHISKSGGSAVGEALSPLAAEFSISLHGHRTTLRDVPEEDAVVFFVREPLSRFVSAFNTRLRGGRPRNDNPPGTFEARAFERFPTPNDLAEALDSAEPARARAAREAMDAIAHVRVHLTDWLESIEYVRSRRSSVVILGLQRFLSDDFEFLKRELGLPDSLKLPSDDIGTHRTPAGFSTELSARGRANIAAWYRDDVTLYRAYQELRAQWFDLEIDRLHQYF